MTDTLELRQLKPATDNPRRKVGDVTELAASIKAIGILEPIVVMKNGAGYVVVAGARRLAAAKKAGLKEVPVRIVELDDRERQEAMLIENLQREDLAPIEEAAAYQRLVDELGVKQRDIAIRIGRSQAHISKRLALLKLPAAAIEAIDSGRITLDDAQHLGKLVAHPERIPTAIDNGARWGRMSDAVRQELEEQKHAEQLAKVQAEAEADPARVVQMVRSQWGEHSLPKGAAWLQGDHYRGDVVPLSPAKHRKFDCHAVTVEERNWGGARLQYVCTKPANHPEANAGGNKLTAAEKTARAKKREHNAALREAAAVRHEFVRGLLSGRLSAAMRDEAIVLLLGEWETREMGVPYHSRGVFAASLLGVEAKKGSYGSLDHVHPVAKAGQDPAQRLKVALAVGIGAFEDSITGTYPQWTQARSYFEFLKRHGYKPSPAERLELTGKAPR